VTSTEEYAPGRLIDVHGDGVAGLVLMWHGRGPNERGALAPLARSVAAHGVRVLAPDWSSEAEDAGRADLLTSVRYARECGASLGLDPGRLVVVGWSLGGTAAVSLTVHAKRLGIPPVHVVLLAPGDGPRAVDALSGSPLPATFPPGRSQIDIVHGTRDEISHAGLVLGLEARLRAAGWRTTLTELDTDHVAILDQPQVTATIVAAATSSS
jgi:dienelactone hydrolase